MRSRSGGRSVTPRFVVAASTPTWTGPPICRLPCRNRVTPLNLHGAFRATLLMPIIKGFLARPEGFEPPTPRFVVCCFHFHMVSHADLGWAGVERCDGHHSQCTVTSLPAPSRSTSTSSRSPTTNGTGVSRSCARTARAASANPSILPSRCLLRAHDQRLQKCPPHPA